MMPDRPMHILHLVAGSDAGGVSQYLLKLGRFMLSRGHRVSVAGERGAWHERFVGTGIEWVDAPLKGNLLQLRTARKTLAKWCEANRPDVVHFHYRRPSLVARRLQPTLPKNQFNQTPPLLYTVHLSHINVSGFRRLFMDVGDHVHVASEEAREWLIAERLATEKNITLIPHGVDTDYFATADTQTQLRARQTLGLPIDATVAAFVGRLDYPKNANWIIDLAIELSKQRQSTTTQFLMVGDGPERGTLQKRVSEAGLRGTVHFLGEINPLVAYQSADALLLPSLREGFAYVCAEAMSVGRAVLRTRTSGTVSMIEEGVTGESVEIDHDAFVKRGAEFLSERDRLIRMGKAGAVRARERFTQERQFEATVQLYRRLAAGE